MIIEFFDKLIKRIAQLKDDGAVDNAVFEEYRKRFTENLKRIRLRAKLTQKKAGLLCGYDEKTAERMYQKWEYGKILPQGYSLYRLSKALKCTTDELLILD